MELHFYPGQLLLAIKQAGVIKHRFSAHGGPAKKGTDPHMAEIPTTAGIFVIEKTHAYRTGTWPLSSIKWGVKLRDRKDILPKGDVWYQLPSGQWGSILKDYGITRDDIIGMYSRLYHKNEVPGTWVFNDFGPIAIRYFKDLNGNNILDGKEKLSGEMLHTTPDDEASTFFKKKVTLTESHGCIHIKPLDRDFLLNLGAFKQGTPFIVHHYHEKI